MLRRKQDRPESVGVGLRATAQKTDPEPWRQGALEGVSCFCLRQFNAQASSLVLEPQVCATMIS